MIICLKNATSNIQNIVFISGTLEIKQRNLSKNWDLKDYTEESSSAENNWLAEKWEFRIHKESSLVEIFKSRSER